MSTAAHGTTSPTDPPAPPGFPFSAVVGQDRLRLALLLCAVHPGIGGVLARGEKGTAKSTVVRALAALLPDPPDGGTARLVELPIGATEDRVVGSLDLGRALADGEHAFSPGLLHRAHQGVLYVDEVNLLGDHLVDVLLDAAAMGRVHVERDGVSHTHPARFVLVGTMNPEEGELRPQLLDRFGLAVEVTASREVDTRVAVVRARLAYEADPEGFAAEHAVAEAELAARVGSARAALPGVALPDPELRRIASLCASFDVDGMRADLVLARTATAHAAWRGASEVTAADVRVAAELALPHRRRRDPFDEPGLDPGALDDAMREAEQPEDAGPPDEPPPDGTDPPEGPDEGPDGPDGPDDDGPDGGGAPPPTDERDGSPTGDEPAPPPAAAPPSRPAGTPGPTFRTRRLEVPGVGEGAPGRRSRARSDHGAVVRSDPTAGRGLHLAHTLLAAAPHQRSRGRDGGRVRLTPADVRRSVREGREGNLVLFVVDASGSMAARDRITAVTGAATSLLRDAYQRRDKVAVVVARGADAEVVLPPTGSVDVAARRLAGLRTGGRTPLAAGLLTARDVLAAARVRDPSRRPLLVLLTDGRATGGPDPVARSRAAAALLARDGTAAVVVDCEQGHVRLGLARALATALGAEHVPLAHVSAERVAGAVRAARPPHPGITDRPRTPHHPAA